MAWGSVPVVLTQLIGGAAAAAAAAAGGNAALRVFSPFLHLAAFDIPAAWLLEHSNIDTMMMIAAFWCRSFSFSRY